MKGIKRVESGWRNSREINTVTYDPSVITTQQLESILKQAGTYRGTAQQ